MGGNLPPHLPVAGGAHGQRRSCALGKRCASSGADDSNVEREPVGKPDVPSVRLDRTVAMTKVRAVGSTSAGITLLLVMAGCRSGEASPPAAPSSATAAPATTTERPPTAEVLAEQAATSAFTQLLRVTDADGAQLKVPRSAH